MAASRNRPEAPGSPRPFPRLYAILDVSLCEARALDPRHVLDEWLDAGVHLVQLRAKRLTFGPFLRLAEPLALACRQAGALFIVNDRLDVAQLAGADGVHLGQNDLTPEHAKSAWPAARWIGLSTHNDPQVEAGLRSAATYLATGPVYPTATKAHAGPVIGLGGVRDAASKTSVLGRPLVAIGGITLATGNEVIRAGATAVAVASDLFVGPTGARAAAYLDRLG